MLSRDETISFSTLDPLPMIGKLDLSIVHSHIHLTAPYISDTQIIHPIVEDLRMKRPVGISVVFSDGLTKAQQEDMVHRWRRTLRTTAFRSHSHVQRILDLHEHDALVDDSDGDESTSSRRDPLFNLRRFPKQAATTSAASLPFYPGQESVFPSSGKRLRWKAEALSVDHLQKIAFSSAESVCPSLSQMTIKLMKRGAFLHLPADIVALGSIDATEASKVRLAACLSTVYRILLQETSVVRIALGRPLQVLNNYARQLMQSGFHDGAEPFSAVGLNGTGVILGVSDTGIDENSCFFIDRQHGKVPRASIEHPHFDLKYRKVIQYLNYSGSSGDYMNGHGSHVSGTLAGNCEASDSHYNSMSAYKGMSSAAQLAFFDIGMNTATSDLAVPYDLGEDVFGPAYVAGARIHSNSWGGGFFYDAYSLSIDAFVQSHPDFLPCFAGGNNGAAGYSTVLSPGIAKTVLAVGATETGHSNGQSIDYIAYFSSLGPTLDGRIKPDVLAPGFSIYSTKAYSENSPQQSCEIEAKAGTSMATPVLAGTAGLVQQYFAQADRFWGRYCNPAYSFCSNAQRTGTAKLSSALFRALLMHGGQAAAAYNGRGTNLGRIALTNAVLPDIYQGHGRVILQNLLPLKAYAEGDKFLCLHEGSLSEMTMDVFRITVTDSNVSLKLTLAWTDVVNDFFAVQLLVNDLDLLLIDPAGHVYYGNGKANTRDEANVNEQILITAPTVGVWTVQVQAKWFGQTAEGVDDAASIVHRDVFGNAKSAKSNVLQEDLTQHQQAYSLVISTSGVIEVPEQDTASQPLSLSDLSFGRAHCTNDATGSNSSEVFSVGTAFWSRVKGTGWSTEDFFVVQSAASIAGHSAHPSNESVDPTTLQRSQFLTRSILHYDDLCLTHGIYQAQLQLSNTTVAGTQASLPSCNIYLSPLTPSQRFLVHAKQRANDSSNNDVNSTVSNVLDLSEAVCLNAVQLETHFELPLNLTEFAAGAGWSGAYYALFPRPIIAAETDWTVEKGIEANEQAVSGTMEWGFVQSKSLYFSAQPSSVSVSQSVSTSDTASDSVQNEQNKQQCYVLYLSTPSPQQLDGDEFPEMYFPTAADVNDINHFGSCAVTLNTSQNLASFCLPNTAETADTGKEDGVVNVLLNIYQPSSQALPVSFGQQKVYRRSGADAMADASDVARKLWQVLSSPATTLRGTCLLRLQRHRGALTTAVNNSTNNNHQNSTDDYYKNDDENRLPALPGNDSRNDKVSYRDFDMTCLSTCTSYPGNLTLHRDLDTSCIFFAQSLFGLCDSYGFAHGLCRVPTCMKACAQTSSASTTRHQVHTTDTSDQTTASTTRTKALSSTTSVSAASVQALWCYLGSATITSCPDAKLWVKSPVEAAELEQACLASTLLYAPDSNGNNGDESVGNSAVDGMGNNVSVGIGLSVFVALLSLGIVVMVGLNVYVSCQARRRSNNPSSSRRAGGSMVSSALDESMRDNVPLTTSPEATTLTRAQRMTRRLLDSGRSFLRLQSRDPSHANASSTSSSAALGRYEMVPVAGNNRHNNDGNTSSGNLFTIANDDDEDEDIDVDVDELERDDYVSYNPQHSSVGAPRGGGNLQVNAHAREETAGKAMSQSVVSATAPAPAAALRTLSPPRSAHHPAHAATPSSLYIPAPPAAGSSAAASTTASIQSEGSAGRLVSIGSRSDSLLQFDLSSNTFDAQHAQHTESHQNVFASPKAKGAVEMEVEEEGEDEDVVVIAHGRRSLDEEEDELRL